jgi:uncharacterized repeat protein (TIGR01451 family)
MKCPSVLLALGAAVVLLVAPAAPAQAATPFSVSPSLIEFGNVPINTTVTADFTVTLDSGYMIGTPVADSGTYPSDSAGHAFVVTADTCPTVEGVGGTCTITLSFTPDAFGGLDFYTVHFSVGVCLSGDDPDLCTGHPTEGTIDLVADGVVVSAFAAAPASIDFGDVPLVTESAPRTVTVTLDAGYAWIGASSTAPFGFAGGTCGSVSIGPATCTVDVGFFPLLPGPATSSNWYVAECPVPACLSAHIIRRTLSLSGNGVSVFSATPASLDFGDVVVGTTAAKTVTLHMDSGYEFAGAAAQGAFSTGGGTCSAGSRGTCTVDAAFAPTSAGSAAATLEFEECFQDDGGCPRNPDPAGVLTAAVAVHGNAVNPVSDVAVAASTSPSPVQNKKPVTFTITVANHGPDAAAGVRLDDTLPSASGFVSYSADQGSCAAPPVGSTGAIVCSIGTLASGATTTLRVIVTPTVKNNTVIEDAAIVSAPSPVVDPVSINNAAAVSVQVR